MGRIRSILIIEELLACTEAWDQATASLRNEAAAMVSALLTDAAKLPDLSVSLLLSRSAVSLLKTQMRSLSPDVRVFSNQRSVEHWLENPDPEPATVDAVMIIAPESAGTLVRRLQVVQSDIWAGTVSLNLPWQLAATFSDKLETAHWLQDHQLPTPETFALSAQDAARLSAVHDRDTARQSTECGGGREEWTAVIKPRDGVGCENVRLIPMTPQTFRAATRVSRQSSPSPANGWVCQPYVRGTACSVSLIGGGVNRPPIILPAGNQTIERQESALRYRGGKVPCDAEHAGAIVPLALALANAIGPFSGWLGADMCVDRDCQRGLRATIIEVNPRLCTSYVGYRLAARQNLAAWMLQQDCPEQPEWHLQPVHFSADGRRLTGTEPADSWA